MPCRSNLHTVALAGDNFTSLWERVGTQQGI